MYSEDILHAIGTVKLTEDILKRSRPKSETLCPIALCIREKLKQTKGFKTCTVRVTGNLVKLFKRGKEIGQVGVGNGLGKNIEEYDTTGKWPENSMEFGDYGGWPYGSETASQYTR